ncbi:hypothetical protein [Kitasatospora viridis]|uniref:Spore-associated protein A n=1 Tax=Kitasatospora viridis TaxID=281105 RepID=A0A561SAJ3_9ACTN|nr:hypothetical protein [Kitasatospora viridis]TWF71857.1 hypothetical protein FHX73_1754 [Kitasatospora viridis]
MKKLAPIIAVLLFATGMAAFTTGSAQAATGCSGTLIDTYPAYNGGTVWANVYLYYDSSTGDNCAVTQSTSAGGYGVSKPMNVYLTRCNETTQSNTCTTSSVNQTVHDAGNYAYYAGPVSINAAGHCILVSGEETYDGVTVSADSHPIASHCG